MVVEAAALALGQMLLELGAQLLVRKQVGLLKNGRRILITMGLITDQAGTRHSLQTRRCSPQELSPVCVGLHMTRAKQQDLR